VGNTKPRIGRLCTKMGLNSKPKCPCDEPQQTTDYIINSYPRLKVPRKDQTLKTIEKILANSSNTRLC